MTLFVKEFYYLIEILLKFSNLFYLRHHHRRLSYRLDDFHKFLKILSCKYHQDYTTTICLSIDYDNIYYDRYY